MQVYVPISINNQVGFWGPREPSGVSGTVTQAWYWVRFAVKLSPRALIRERKVLYLLRFPSALYRDFQAELGTNLCLCWS